MKTLADIKRRAVAGARLEVVEQTRRPVLVGTVRTITEPGPAHKPGVAPADRRCYDWADADGERYCTNWPKARDVAIIDADTFEYRLPRRGLGAQDDTIRLRFLPAEDPR
jgi:hypothetical protein